MYWVMYPKLLNSYKYLEQPFRVVFFITMIEPTLYIRAQLTKNHEYFNTWQRWS